MRRFARMRTFAYLLNFDHARRGCQYRSKISPKLAAYFWIGRIARYCHLHTLAPAQTGARPSAEHRNRGVPRDRRTQHIDVRCGAHDDAAQRHPIRTTFELDGAGRNFPLGGLSLRSHAYSGADHRCNRNYSSDSHVVPVVRGPLPAGSQIKQAGSMLRNQTITPHPAYLLAWLPAHYIPCLRFVGRMPSKADIRTAESHVWFTPESGHCAVQLGVSAMGQKRTSDTRSLARWIEGHLQGATADHSCCVNDDMVCLARWRRAHDSARSSNQST